MMLDGARVLRYAVLDGPGKEDGIATFCSGTPLDRVCGLVVAQNLVEDGVYLMHCNDEWATLAASQFPDAESALRTFALENGEVEAAWREFRPLTAAERAEVETTREFLREIARDFPGDR
jgi:hypothetical protein